MKSRDGFTRILTLLLAASLLLFPTASASAESLAPTIPAGALTVRFDLCGGALAETYTAAVAADDSATVTPSPEVAAGSWAP